MKKTLLLMAAAFMATAASAQIDVATAAPVFNVNTVDAGLSAHGAAVNMSLAAIDNMLLVCEGNADGNITVINAADGTKLRAVPMAMATGSICNDDAGNVVAINYTPAGETANIYYQGDIMSQPTLLHSFVNDTDLAIGYKMSVTGTVTGDAAIVIVNEGVSGVTSSMRFTLVLVKGGEVASVEVKDATASGLSWGAAPANVAGIAAASADANGYFVTYYQGPGLTYLASDMTTVVDGPELDASGWGTNPNCVDIATIGGKTYLAAYTPSFFPTWGCPATVYLYDVTEPEKFNDNQLISIAPDFFAGDNDGAAAGAVNLVAAKDGNSVALYYVDHNSQNIGAYSAAATTGVEDIEVSENAPAVYYNLQGVQVENPANGLFIVKQGKKVTKQYIK